MRRENLKLLSSTTCSLRHLPWAIGQKKNILLLLFSAIFTTTFPQKSLKLSQAVQMAQKHNPSIQSYKFNTQATKTIEKQAMSGYYPQITFQSSAYFASGSKSLQNKQTLQASQLIYSFSGPLQKKYIAKKGSDIAKYSEEIQKNYIRNQVETVFLQNYLQQAKKETIESLRKSAQANLEKAKNQKLQKLIGKNEWLQELADYENNIATVNFYIDQITQAEKQLEYLIGKPIYSTPSQTKPKLKWDEKHKIIKPKNLDFYVDQAMKNRPEIKSSQKSIEIYQKYADLYIKKYLPDIGITGQASRTSGGTNDCNIGLSLTWNIFDGALNFHKQDQAHANKLKSMMEKESNIQLVKYEVSNAYHDLKKALKELTAQKHVFAQAKNEFDLQKQQLKIGTTSQVDLDTAKYNFEQSKINLLTYKINAASKKYNLLYACGYPESPSPNGLGYHKPPTSGLVKYEKN